MTGNSSTRQIVAIGGGGLSTESDNLLLEQYLLKLANKESPKICFVPTASGDSQSYIDRFDAAFAQLPCIPSHLLLFRLHTADLRSFVLEQDIIYVGGGNTKNLLALWKDWGLDTIIREAWEQGVILAGWSAGSICWFEEGVTDSFPGELRVLRCLGFLKGSNCPHYDGEPERKPSYHRLLAEGLISEGYAADDGVALHFLGTQLEKIVSSRPHAKAYRLEKVGETVKESPLEPTYLEHNSDMSKK
ncbi:MAG TPA: peptidase E [Candidatus Sericytochromatia bacterium]